MAYENDWNTLGNVAMRIGNAAGIRYGHFYGQHITNRAEQEQYLCKRMLDLAQNAFIAAKNRDGQLISLHNLANQLRFMGEDQEAIKIIKQVIKEAKTEGYTDTLTRARKLQQRLKKPQDRSTNAE